REAASPSKLTSTTGPMICEILPIFAIYEIFKIYLLIFGLQNYEFCMIKQISVLSFFVFFLENTKKLALFIVVNYECTLKDLLKVLKLLI
ncbi:MAG: hypothetical protein KA188_10315, partial [Leadbetterella sp.]|nr:hypothetical protein [Leadbetterella sp.]